MREEEEEEEEESGVEGTSGVVGRLSIGVTVRRGTNGLFVIEDDDVGDTPGG